MDRLNLFFTAYFTLELFINAYANWLKAFIANGWNHLDVFIVLMSLLDLGALSIPDWFVKLVRAFRVIRLFGRINALRKMAAAVTASIFPMMNAFVILLIVLSICESAPSYLIPAHNITSAPLIVQPPPCPPSAMNSCPTHCAALDQHLTAHQPARPPLGSC
jgi:hypothetical protein